MKNLELVFNALSDPIRLEILRKLHTEKSLCVSELVEIFNMPQSKLSYHLKLLYTAELVNKKTKGRWNYYSVNNRNLARYLTRSTIKELFS